MLSRLMSERRASWLAFAGPLLVLALLSVALLGPELVFLYNGSTHEAQTLSMRLAGASWRHPLGMDLLGRDVLARLSFGVRLSVFVGVSATCIATPIGVTYGIVAGYFGGRAENLMMRWVDIMSSLPEIILLSMLLALFNRSALIIIMALAAASWPTMARMVHGAVVSLRHLPFVEAARGIGLPPYLVMGRHILPNVLPTVIVYATLTLPSVVLADALLGFLGVGIPPPASSLGVLIQEGADAIGIAPRLLFVSSVALAGILLVFNLLGDLLRDASSRKA